MKEFRLKIDEIDLCLSILVKEHESGQEKHEAEWPRTGNEIPYAVIDMVPEIPD